MAFQKYEYNSGMEMVQQKLNLNEMKQKYNSILAKNSSSVR